MTYWRSIIANQYKRHFRAEWSREGQCFPKYLPLRGVPIYSQELVAKRILQDRLKTCWGSSHVALVKENLFWRSSYENFISKRNLGIIDPCTNANNCFSLDPSKNIHQAQFNVYIDK